MKIYYLFFLHNLKIKQILIILFKFFFYKKIEKFISLFFKKNYFIIFKKNYFINLKKK